MLKKTKFDLTMFAYAKAGLDFTFNTYQEKLNALKFYNLCRSAHRNF